MGKGVINNYSGMSPHGMLVSLAHVFKRGAGRGILKNIRKPSSCDLGPAWAPGCFGLSGWEWLVSICFLRFWFLNASCILLRSFSKYVKTWASRPHTPRAPGSPLLCPAPTHPKEKPRKICALKEPGLGDGFWVCGWCFFVWGFWAWDFWLWGLRGFLFRPRRPHHTKLGNSPPKHRKQS